MVVHNVVGFGSFLLSGAARGIAWIFTAPFIISFLGVYIAAVVVTWANAPLIFTDPVLASGLITMYLVLGSAALAYGGASTPLLEVSFAAGILYLTLGVAVGGLLFSFLQPITPNAAPIVEGAWWGVLVVAAFVVAIGEELVFRVAFPLYFGGGAGGQFLSNVVFTGMHVYTYSLQATSSTELASALVFVAVLGFACAYLTEAIPGVGFLFGCALHLSWNLYTYGILGA